MIERVTRPRVAPEDQDGVYQAQMGYPDRYLTCDICKVGQGQKCRSLSGKVVNGRPDGVRTELNQPHRSRRISRRKPK